MKSVRNTCQERRQIIEIEIKEKFKTRKIKKVTSVKWQGNSILYNRANVIAKSKKVITKRIHNSKIKVIKIYIDWKLNKIKLNKLSISITLSSTANTQSRSAKIRFGNITGSLSHPPHLWLKQKNTKRKKKSNKLHLSD